MKFLAIIFTLFFIEATMASNLSPGYCSNMKGLLVSVSSEYPLTADNIDDPILAELQYLTYGIWEVVTQNCEEPIKDPAKVPAKELCTWGIELTKDAQNNSPSLYPALQQVIENIFQACKKMKELDAG